MFPRTLEEVTIDRWIREHDAGEHDAWGNEEEKCPACEDRYQDEQADLHELWEEENRK